MGLFGLADQPHAERQHCDPEILGSVAIKGGARSLVARDERLYIASSFVGLQIIDISQTDDLSVVGAIAWPDGEANGLQVIGDIAYVAAGKTGLQVVDVSDVHRLITTSHLQLPFPAVGIVVKGDYAYIAASEAGVCIVDISQPRDPRLITIIDTPDFAMAITIKNDIAYVANGDSGLQMIDISDVENPRILSSLNTPDIAVDVAVQANTAYVDAVSPGKIYTVDISRTSAPRILGVHDVTHNYINGVDISSELVFVASGRGVVVLQQAPDGHNLVELTTLSPTSHVQGVSADGDIVYVGGLDRITLYNVSACRTIVDGR